MAGQALSNKNKKMFVPDSIYLPKINDRHIPFTCEVLDIR
jgi:hypothetical protein